MSLNGENFGIIEATYRYPSQGLLVVPHKGQKLTVSYPPFGPGYYQAILLEREGKYFHSEKRPEISFRPATTSESISALSYNFKDLFKTEVIDNASLEIGYILRTSNGIFVNPPRDNNGEIIMEN